MTQVIEPLGPDVLAADPPMSRSYGVARDCVTAI
jgi:hypothetical protein